MNASFRNRDESNLQNPIAAVASGADMSKVTCLDENCTVKEANGKLYIMTTEAEQEKDAVLYAVYTLDGTADGEITRTKLLSSYSGETVSVPNTALAARKFTDADGLYDIYECISADKNQITLEKGDNIIYITVKHADGKYYYWEDFESYDAGSIEKDNKWYHGGASTVSDFINCTTDNADTTLAARWYSSNTSAARNKNFSIFSGTPEIPNGEKLVFSADFRMSQTRNADYRTSLSVGNGTDTMMLMSVANSVTASLNGDTTIVLPETAGTKEETGGDNTAFSKWINVNITIDPDLTKNNTTVTLTPLNDGDTFIVTKQNTPDSGFEYRDGAVSVYEDGTLIIADYDGNGVLKDIETKEVSSGDNIPVVSVNNRKIMLWNGMGKMEPLCDAVTLPIEEKPVETKTETVSSYSYKMTSDVNAVTQMSVNLCKGYRGAVVADNIKLYNTQSEYLTPAKNELAQAIAIYGDIDESLYTGNGISEYNTAVTNANSVLADSGSSNKDAKDAKTTLVNAASALTLRPVQDGDRTVINENADWIFIKEKNYQSEISEITDSAPDELSLSGWTGVSVPHTWNAYDGSDGGGDYDTCKSWYRKSMYIDSAYEGKKVYLEFDGASIRTELYINGVHVPFSYDDPFGTANSYGVEYEHKGGFNTFSEYGGAAIVGNTYEYNADGSVDFLGTSAESNTTYQAYLHEKVYQEFTTSANAYRGKYVWQMFDSASDGKTDGTMLGVNTKGLVSYDHVTRKDAYYFYKANWNNFEPFAFVVNASRTQRPDPTTIIRAYTNMDLCQLYVNGEKYGKPITDTNANDAVADGVHVFMWYDVPLTGGDDKIEVRGIKDGRETCSSLDTNGEITFKTMFDGTSIKSNNASKLIINGSDAVMQCPAKDAPAVSEVRDIVTILSTSSISILMPGGTAADGKLSEGMKIRVTAADGKYKDYTVKVDDITNDAVISASEGNASILADGNTSASWNGGAGSSVTIDLGAEYNLNAVDMYSVGETAYNAEISSDGTSYTSAAVTEGRFAADTSGRYVRFTFTNAAEVSEINIYGWRFDNIGNYRIDGKNIYLSTSSEHDTDELMTNLLLVGQAAYDFVLEEATRVLSDGAILRVTEKYGDTVDYTIKISD